eukprot:gene6405-7429_t
MEYISQFIELLEARTRYATPEFPGAPVATLLDTVDQVSKSTEPFAMALSKVDCSATATSTSANGGTFNISKYFESLGTLVFGHSFIYAPMFSSTQTLMLKYFTFTGQGLVMATDSQFAGKGRGGNTWTAPQGGLFFSFKCKQSDGTKLPFLQYLVGLALVSAVSEFNVAGVDIRLKWPNDVYAGSLKIGGILCQSNYFNGAFDVVVGVGINVDNDEPTVSLNGLSERANHPRVFTRELLLARFLNTFENMYLRFNRDGFTSFEQNYTKAWLHSNQVVTLAESGRTVKIVGLTPNGFLRAVECEADGRIKSDHIVELHPDGTSFDLQNLVLKPKVVTPPS